MYRKVWSGNNNFVPVFKILAQGELFSIPVCKYLCPVRIIVSSFNQGEHFFVPVFKMFCPGRII